MAEALSETFEEDEDFGKSLQKELGRLLEECQQSLDHIDIFIGQTTAKLTSYELKNANLIREFNSNNSEVEKLIDQCLHLIEEYEEKLYLYERSLVNIRSNFDELELFSVWELKQKNKIELCNTLEQLIEKFDIRPEDMDSFFERKHSILPLEMEEFARKLADTCRGALPAGFNQLACVEAQLKANETTSQLFCSRFTEFIINLINQEVQNVKVSRFPTGHKMTHDVINIYHPIVSYMKILYPVKYSEIYSTYCRSFCDLYRKECYLYLDHAMKKVPAYDTQTVDAKKDAKSPLFRDPEEIDSRERIFIGMLNDAFKVIQSVSNDVGTYGGRFFSFTVKVPSLSRQHTVGLQKNDNKQKGSDLKVRAMLRSIFEFLGKLFYTLFEECSKRDFYYLISALQVIQTYQTTPSDNDFFNQFIARLPACCDQLFKSSIFNVLSIIDSKTSSKKLGAPLVESIKHFKAFLLVCHTLTSKHPTTSPALIDCYHSILKHILSAIDNAALEEAEKSLRPIQIIENLYHLHACLSDVQISELADERKKLRSRYTSEVDSFVKSFLAKSFSKLFVFINEIEEKIQDKVTEQNIAAYVYNNRVDLKRALKDFDFRDIKKCIEKMHKLSSKYFKDWALFATLWNAMTQQTIDQINRINLYISKYCTKLPEIKLGFKMEDISQLIHSFNS